MRKVWSHGLGILICAALLAAGCESKTAEERGAELAKDKLDFVKGAAGVLNQEGKDVGESSGKGVGDLIKGLGSGVKDVVFSTVPVQVASESASSGIAVGKATESGTEGGKRMVDVYLTFSTPFDGRLRLRAFEAGEVETGSAEIEGNVHRKAGESGTFRFGFDESIRLSKVQSCALVTLPAEKRLRLDPGATEAGLEADRFQEKTAEGKYEVSLYTVFKQAFKGTAQLRLFDADNREMARSETSAKIDQAADSSSDVVFAITQPIDAARVDVYELHATPAPVKRKAKTKTPAKP